MTRDHDIDLCEKKTHLKEQDKSSDIEQQPPFGDRKLTMGKNAAFIKNENEFSKNYDFYYTWSNDHIQHVFQISERSYQYSKRYGILKILSF